METNVKKKDVLIEEVQRRYTNEKNTNEMIMKVINKHGLNKEVTQLKSYQKAFHSRKATIN